MRRATALAAVIAGVLFITIQCTATRPPPGQFSPVALTANHRPAETDVDLGTFHWTIITHHPRPDILRLSTTVHTNREPLHFGMQVIFWKWSAVVDRKTKAKIYVGCTDASRTIPPYRCVWTLGRGNLPAVGVGKHWHWDALCSTGRYYAEVHLWGVSHYGILVDDFTYWPSKPGSDDEDPPDRADSYQVKLRWACPPLIKGSRS